VKKRKIFFLVVFISLAVFLTGCLPKKSIFKNEIDKKTEPLVPSDWMEYVSQAQGFSFSYPPSWSLEVVRDEADSLILSLKMEDTSQEMVFVYEEMVPSYQITMAVEENDEGLTAKQKHLNNFTASSRAGEEENISQVSYGGAEGIKYLEGVAPSSGPGTGILLSFKDKFYRLTYSALAHKETHEKYLGDFEKILSSLRFTE